MEHRIYPTPNHDVWELNRCEASNSILMNHSDYIGKMGRYFGELKAAFNKCQKIIILYNI